ncbi:MAG: alkaline phosphatase family protein [Alistipes sp.]|nr:alkaline phosphatase family protein [Alistipes sp.]
MQRIFSILICVLMLATAPRAVAQERPTLVINIVVGSMRASDLDRYYSNFTERGIRRLMESGVTYTEAYYDFSALSTVAGLATLSTGANPAVHGVVGERWFSHTDAKPISLIADNKAYPVEFSTGSGNYSPNRLTAPTYGDMMLSQNSESKLFTVAGDALSAIVLNGRRGIAFWAEKNKTYWTTSSAYTEHLHKWIADYNKNEINSEYAINRWTTLYKAEHYHNSEVGVVEGIKDKPTHLITNIDHKIGDTLYDQMMYTPAGNSMILHFAEQLLRKEWLGRDNNTDVLNIYLDPARNIAEKFGPESIEYEDMLYRLDKDLIWFLESIYAHVEDCSRVVVVLSSDHGTSPSYNAAGGEARHRFNHRQMEVIVNAYLGGRYGSESYVAGYANNSLYLNHATLTKKGLKYAEICDEVATFLLQLQGISTAISATSMRTTSFSEGRTALMQQSFFGARTGDVMIDLVPGCIIEDDSRRSLSTSGYVYDRHVPLIIYRQGMKKRSVERRISMTELAPTLCHIMGIERTWATDKQALEEFK